CDGASGPGAAVPLNCSWRGDTIGRRLADCRGFEAFSTHGPGPGAMEAYAGTGAERGVPVHAESDVLGIDLHPGGPGVGAQQPVDLLAGVAFAFGGALYRGGAGREIPEREVRRELHGLRDQG